MTSYLGCTIAKSDRLSLESVQFGRSFSGGRGRSLTKGIQRIWPACRSLLQLEADKFSATDVPRRSSNGYPLQLCPGDSQTKMRAPLPQYSTTGTEWCRGYNCLMWTSTRRAGC